MGKKRKRPASSAVQEAADISDDEGELIGFVDDGELFLRNAKSGIIYSSERDQLGRRVQVGNWDAASGKPLFSPKAVAPEAAVRTAAPAPAPSVPHPPPERLTFSADEEDHCETAPQAYEDIGQLLHLIAAHLGKKSSDLRIYDPYYCNGAVARHLNALGFPHVYNRNEDFYAVLAAGEVPPHDVVVTNPPYSGTHPQRVLRFLHENRKPWLALMPNWVYAKDYYEVCAVSSDSVLSASASTSSDTLSSTMPSPSPVKSPFYLVPYKRYYYWTPRGRRSDLASGGAKSKTHGHSNAALGVRTSPFVSFWYVGGITQTFCNQLRSTPIAKISERCRLCWSTSDLPPGVWADTDSRRWISRGTHGIGGGKR